MPLRKRLLENETTVPIDIRSLMRILPHRYPFLLVDRILEVDPSMSPSSSVISPTIR